MRFRCHQILYLMASLERFHFLTCACCAEGTIGGDVEGIAFGIGVGFGFRAFLCSFLFSLFPFLASFSWSPRCCDALIRRSPMLRFEALRRK